MVEGLGWLNLALVFLMILIYPIKRLYLDKRKPKLLKLYKAARYYHPLLGFIIVLIGLTHGYLAIGSIRLHTGTLVVLTVILMGCITVLGRRKLLFQRNWRKIHVYLVPLLFIFIFVHIFFRNII